MFTWTPAAGSNAPDLVALNKALSVYGKLPAPVADCPVVEPQDGALPPEVSTELINGFEQQLLKQTSPAPLGMPSSSRVRVAIIDSAALKYAATGSDYYGHGRSMGRIVHRLACSRDDATCAIDIDNQLALPHRSIYERNDTTGGTFGTRIDLALAIERALFAWGNAALIAGTPAPPLVLNLSLGWDALHGGTVLTPNDPAGYVYLALQRAACMGVATIVAAGNAAGDSRSGFMLPARWHERVTPDQSTCSKITGFPWDAPGLQRPRSPSGTTRLLETVAAVDVHDVLLPTARTGATPRFVAYGQTATNKDPSRRGFTDVMTGSSVATAVLSAAVASAWSNLPSATPDGVLQHVYSKSVALGRTVEPCLRSPCTQVRRVAVCDAARAAACEGRSCYDVAPCDTVPASAGSTSLDAEALFDAASSTLPTSDCSRAGACTSTSGPNYAYAPWVGPQPGPQTCPYCFVFVSAFLGRAILVLSPTLQHASSTQVRLGNGRQYQVTSASPWLPEVFTVAGINTNGMSGAANRWATLVSVIGEDSEARVNETPLTVY